MWFEHSEKFDFRQLFYVFKKNNSPELCLCPLTTSALHGAVARRAGAPCSSTEHRTVKDNFMPPGIASPHFNKPRLSNQRSIGQTAYSAERRGAAIDLKISA
jgi:hypothetical protein